jgi:hypothetical protein
MSYSFTFEKIKKTDILLIDKNYSEFKFKHRTEIFNYRKIYIQILLKSLFIYFIKKKNKRLKDIYLKLYLNKLKPKVIIGHQANKLIFELKEHSPESKIIIYLHCRLYLLQLKELGQDLKKSKIDYFFVCDQIHKDYLKKYTKAKFIISGLPKNNEKKLKKEKKIYDIAYVSEYRNVNYFFKREHQYYMQFIVKTLNEFSLMYPEKRIVIALNSNRLDKKIPKKEEINFLKRYSPNLKIAPQRDSYETCNKSKLLIVLNSNLGAEFLSRKVKVLFLPYLDLLKGYRSGDYLSVYFKKNFFFVYKKLQKRIIFRKINQILSLNNNSWNKSIEKSKINIIMDKNNKILKNKISKIIKDSR